MRPPAIEAARHVVLGDAGAAALVRAGARDVIVLRDLLAIGPCARDPRRHAHVRRGFWRSFLGELYPSALRAAPPERTILGRDELARSLRRRPRAPVVMWTAARWSERRALAFAAGPLARIDAWIAPAGPFGASAADAARLGAILARAARAGPELAALDRLWRAYVRPAPAEMPGAVRGASRLLPDLPRSSRVYLDLFPRVRGKRLHVSALDRLLLGAHAEPMALVGVLRLRPRLSRRLLLSLGDLVLDVRRHAWLARGALEVAEDDPVPLRRRLRLTAYGARILRGGLERPAEAPPLFAGGHELYGPATWAARGGRLAPWAPRRRAPPRR
ncbi:MAG TPA: hypothetical protein VFK90_17760 [Anaeromyxobacter sp.]|nr:hypothetical protein [Anaeromyxobacter sp.]